MAILANFGLEGAPLDWAGIKVLPRALGALGQDIVGAHVSYHKLDAVIMLADLWPFFGVDLANINFVPWFPVDHEPLDEPNRTVAARSLMPIVYSKFAVETCRAAGLEVDYVPHGIDTNIYCPGDKRTSRDRLHLPQDAFLVLMVAANKGYPSRKAFAQQIEAFARLKKAHPDALLYMHTTKGSNGEMQGVDIPRICESVGLHPDKDVWWTPEYLMWIGIDPHQMAELYRAADVLMSVSCGEGFGLPIVEAQSCGTPVVVGDWTSMSELCFSGWRVEKDKADRFWLPTGSYQYNPRVGAIYEKLRDAYRHARDTGMGERARAGALQYDADKVLVEYWQPQLEKIEARVGDIAGTISGLRDKWRAVA